MALANALKQNQFNPLAMRVITKLTQLSHHYITEKSETF
ncbi:hypothetical protein [Acinetobacter bereziniae]|nr:hypothetical protein [Acinetobacter bereziniae]